MKRREDNEEWFNAYGVRVEQIGTELTGVGKWWFNGSLYSNQTGSYGEIFNDYANNVASGTYSHAEGIYSAALGNGGSHAEGASTIASGESSHTEGSLIEIDDKTYYTTASGKASHAEGGGTTASGDYSHTEGYNTSTELTKTVFRKSSWAYYAIFARRFALFISIFLTAFLRCL